MVMKSDKDAHDARFPARSTARKAGASFVKRPVRSDPVVTVGVTLQDSTQVGFAQDKGVIE
jgi:hypothetical protein